LTFSPGWPFKANGFRPAGPLLIAFSTAKSIKIFTRHLREREIWLKKRRGSLKLGRGFIVRHPTGKTPGWPVLLAAWGLRRKNFFSPQVGICRPFAVWEQSGTGATLAREKPKMGEAVCYWGG